MIDISVKGLVKSFEQDKNILDGLSFEVNTGERVGILGRNGCGKTTLFRILTGELRSDEGTVSIYKGKRLGLISQIPVYPEGYTTDMVLQDAHRRLYAMQERINALTAEMASDHSPQVLEEYDRLSAEFQRCGGYDMERERNRVANGLDIPPAMRAQPFDSLSGGEKTRVNLARLILEDTDILLLDEPTNHLDLNATEWLEDYLRKFHGTVLAISHDRYFLDQVTQRSIEIHDGKAEFYNGNYSFYVVERQRRFDEQLKKYEKDQAKLEQLQKAAAQLHLWAFMGNDKLHKRAFSMEKRMEKLQQTERPKTDRKLTVKFQESEFLADEVMVVDNVSKAFGDRTLFSDLTLDIRGGERIALIGDNGTGKSTFLKLIMNEETPDTGFIRKGPAVRTAYLPQIVTFPVAERSIYDTMLYETKCTPQGARDRLAAFGFMGEDVFKPVGALSGGERSRLKLCMLMGEQVNLLILDEPTNHLDIASREWMEDALSDYTEALLFVSHDRYFIEKFATRVWELRDGHITDYKGTFSQYREYKARQAQFVQAAKNAEKQDAPKPKKEQRKRPPNIEKQIAKLEKEIEKLEAQSAQLDAQSEEFASDYQKLLDIAEEKETITAQLEQLYADWEDLSGLL
ncbi:MAG: ABC-F family ATP-binding cassette domain-containing protein [Oscillospiraceae bacterium]|jgi:ATP-binding cassette subfamily F protein 3|nr:ABC-F family ATP-binding cassette domain-containing protein [Oscillospiraceae bacterium]